MDTRTKPLIVFAALVVAAGLAALALYRSENVGNVGTQRDAAALPETLTMLQETPGNPLVQDAEFIDAEGRKTHLSDFHGRFVLLNMWAKWCPPCVNELPALARAQAALPHDRIAIVAVDLENNEPADVMEFLRAHGAQGLAAYVDRDLGLMRSFKAYGLPLTVIIDPEGHEVARAFGPEKWDGREALMYLRGLIAKSDQRVGTGTSPR